MAFGSVLTVVFALVTCGTVGAQTLPSVPCGLSSAKYPFRFNFVKGKLANSQGLTRIIGGTTLSPHTLPWQAVLYLDGNLCGGSLISDRHILTAAHCIGMKPWAEMRTKVESVMRTSKYSVIVGAHNRQQYGGAGWPEFMTQQIIWGVERIDVHDGWNPVNNMNDDIALITLSYPVWFTDEVRPVCLPSASDNFQKTTEMGVVAGWGRTDNANDRIADVLQHVVLKFMPLTTCKSRWGGSAIGNGMVCIDTSKATGTCQGDSGGPLLAYRQKRFVLAGVTSFGTTECASRTVPTVFTHVPSYVNWIKPRMK